MSADFETPQKTLTRFDQNISWRNSNEKVLTSDFLSANGESNLLWTPFYYEEIEGKLFDPIREKFIEGSANGDIIEEGVVTQLQDWFSNHDSGLAVWISPRGNGTRPYPEEQITIYKIGYKNIDADRPLQKVLLFTWHQFKHKFENPEEIRRFIFTENDDDKSVLEIIQWLKNTSEKPVSDDYGDIKKRRESASQYVTLYKSGVPMPELAYQMDQTKFLGDNPIGCPTSNNTKGFGYYSNTTEAPQYTKFSTTDTGWHNGECRMCHSYTWVGGCNICQPCVDLHFS